MGSPWPVEDNMLKLFSFKRHFCLPRNRFKISAHTAWRAPDVIVKLWMAEDGLLGERARIGATCWDGCALDFCLFSFLFFVVRMLEWIVGKQGLKTESWERRLSFDQNISEKG